jgi:hypothetical protein
MKSQNTTNDNLVQFMKVLLPTVMIGIMGAACGSSSNNADGAGGPPQSNGAAPSGTAGQVHSILISGRGSFADGTPIAGESVQYQLILDGANMFQAGSNGCLPTPAHVAGTVIETATPDRLGNYSLNIPVTQLRAAVVKSCSIQQLSASQVEDATIRASILANATTCPAFCSAQGTAGGACVDDCEKGNRTIVASQAVSPAQMGALLQQAQGSGGNIQWNQNLSFVSLGPVLTPGGLPDLQVDAAAAQASAHVDQETFDGSSCEVAEQCVRAAGLRTVLRFDGTIENLGNADLVIGDPTNSPLFTSSSCHNVQLLKNIMLYELVDPATGANIQVDNQAVLGRKQGFCMMDIMQINAAAPQGQYNCNYQGITTGWADVYDAALDCQFLDVTGVSPGNYTLRLTVNPDQLFQESDYNNNTIEVPVTVPSSPPTSSLSSPLSSFGLFAP